MDVLLAIKPEFAEKILDGSKRYEFRRTPFQDSEKTDLIFLYASAPISKIVGVFISNRMVEADPAELWALFGAESGIENRERFMSYFEGADTGFAIKVDKTCRFEDPIHPHNVFDGFSPPMSFNYLDTNEAEALRSYVPRSFHEYSIETSLNQFE